MLVLHVPRADEFAVRQRWLADPAMMSFNSGWDVPHPGYDRTSGCIDWPESEWPAFEERLGRPGQGYFYVLDTGTGEFIGHVHYEVDAGAVASIGFNVVPARRGEGLGGEFVRLLLERVWADSDAVEAANEFEDGRVAAVRVHERAGFVPDPDPTMFSGRPVRVWRLRRPTGPGAPSAR